MNSIWPNIVFEIYDFIIFRKTMKILYLKNKYKLMLRMKQINVLSSFNLIKFELNYKIKTEDVGTMRWIKRRDEGNEWMEG